eukprot:3014429-Pleurochrysis_carterae.AAC.1
MSENVRVCVHEGVGVGMGVRIDGMRGHRRRRSSEHSCVGVCAEVGVYFVLSTRAWAYAWAWASTSS